MLKSKLFFVAALLLGGCLTINATNCYHQAEVYAVGHGKIYADGSDCMPDSIFLMGKEAYKTQMSALFSVFSSSPSVDSTTTNLVICTLPDAPEYKPVGVKFDSLEADMSGVYLDTCSWTTEEEVTYLTQRIRTEEVRKFKADTTHGVVYVIFKVKPELVQAACDSIDNYVASKTEVISEELRLAIEEGKKTIRENDDDLDKMNAALDAAIKAVDEYLPSALTDIRSQNVNVTKHMVNGRLFIEANDNRYNVLGQEVK
ncbi:MAG: hypothetical protein MJZ59_02035 [Paludibacteraceae bacterium]|nr:hypothetical protein [Paludibacteraceae bacterium]